MFSKAGAIVHRIWALLPDTFPGLEIDTFVVMPDHVHAIVIIAESEARSYDLSDVVASAKRRASVEIASLPGAPRGPIWQRSFHDRILRDAAAVERVRAYIADNPRRAWDRRIGRIGRRDS